jgi:tetratricopeptide (TPR) repeat protein
VLRSVESRISERLNDRRFGLLVAPSVGCRAVLARCLAELGCFDEAIEVGDECLTRADDLGHAFSLIHACVYVSQVLLRKGDFAQSIPILERGLALCRTVHGRLLLPMSASALGYAKVLAGHGGQGLAALELAVKHPTEDPMTAHLALGSIWLAEAYLHLGRPAKAVHPALQALDRSVRNSERGHEGWALRALGEAYTGIAESTGASAEACFLKAWDIATALGMKPLAAHCHFGLAKHYRRVRARHEARARFEAALQAFRELGMDRWATESEAALVQNDRLSNQRAVRNGSNVLAGH